MEPLYERIGTDSDGKSVWECRECHRWGQSPSSVTHRSDCGTPTRATDDAARAQRRLERTRRQHKLALEHSRHWFIPVEVVHRTALRPERQRPTVVAWDPYESWPPNPRQLRADYDGFFAVRRWLRENWTILCKFDDLSPV